MNTVYEEKNKAKTVNFNHLNTRSSQLERKIGEATSVVGGDPPKAVVGPARLPQLAAHIRKFYSRMLRIIRKIQSTITV